MIRINLIPPEITQKRKTESRLYLIGVVFLVIVFLMGGFFVTMLFQVSLKRQELASVEQEFENLRLQAERFKIFEDKEGELASREQVAAQALAGRIDWSRLYEEISLVLPDDVWIDSLSSAEDPGAGLTLVCHALDYRDDVPDVGHKAVALALVRLTDLEQLSEVWLTSSMKLELGEDYLESQIDFTITAVVREPDSAASAGSGPVPPGQSP